ncbi:DNA-directed RNA polymerase V subunit 1 [Dorcoceras hygrometricum]|uniref:DNA-directed RNA polymerase V subunit 1 n=1 Tax=Dorcoceras hygrometricum TaxID=472368 RepID=A0A2Z7BY05_9LAMI|nr:DNA-directed RNA polymerase V subunit 1 [Dorcoceras hygrometricum]
MMSLFDLQDVCIAIGSLATLDLPMVVDLIGIYGLKGPYCTLNTTNWFLQALSVIPRGSWGRFKQLSPELEEELERWVGRLGCMVVRIDSVEFCRELVGEWTCTGCWCCALVRAIEVVAMQKVRYE